MTSWLGPLPLNRDILPAVGRREGVGEGGVSLTLWPETVLLAVLGLFGWGQFVKHREVLLGVLTVWLGSVCETQGSPAWCADCLAGVSL